MIKLVGVLGNHCKVPKTDPWYKQDMKILALFGFGVVIKSFNAHGYGTTSRKTH